MNIKIETEHLSLRLLTENDLDNLEQLNADPDVRAFFPDGTQNREQTRKRMLELINNHKEHNLPGFIISEKESHAFLGRCGFSLLEDNEVEVGYLLHKNYWGKGYATEALNALLNWAKKNISRQYIIAFAPTEHVASQRVMEKCGMALYKTDIAHGVECKFYKIKNTPIKERSCNTMTRNMIIREPAMADKAAFIQAMQRSQALHSPWVVSPQTEEKFDEYIQRSQKANQKYFLACNAVGNIVGVFNISEIVLGVFQSAYLGFYSVENYAGQGYMSHGLKLVLRNIFEEIKLHRIEANIQPENVRSINLVKANGFSKEGFSPRYLSINGAWCDHERWALTYEDWIKCRL